jgi:hypothetical protein
MANDPYPYVERKEIINLVLEWLLEERQSYLLSPKLRSAIADVLNKPLLALKQDKADVIMAAIDSRVRWVEARKREDGMRRGAKQAALKQVAEQYGKDPDTLYLDLYRYGKRMAERKILAQELGVDITDPLVTRTYYTRRPRRKKSKTKISKI